MSQKTTPYSGIEKAARRHIRNIRAVGQEPTQKEVCHKIIDSSGWRQVKKMTELREIDVEVVVGQCLREPVVEAKKSLWSRFWDKVLRHKP